MKDGVLLMSDPRIVRSLSKRKQLRSTFLQIKSSGLWEYSMIIKKDLGGGGGCKVRFRLLQYLKILLFIAGEPQKLAWQKYISLESSFHNIFFSHFRGIGKTLSLLEVTIMHFALIVQ